MAASSFDALEASRKLRQAGIEQQHAEAIADQLRSAASADLNQLATKADVAAVKTDVTWLRWGLGVNGDAEPRIFGERDLVGMGGLVRALGVGTEKIVLKSGVGGLPRG